MKKKQKSVEQEIDNVISGIITYIKQGLKQTDVPIVQLRNSLVRLVLGDRIVPGPINID